MTNTWGHSKDHRPDLKQLLYILTISEDGGVPVYFTSASGNQVDDRTHCETWDLLHQLVGRPEFLYVADCKLASSENLSHIATRGGRFVTVLPRTHKEDEVFRARLASGGPYLMIEIGGSLAAPPLSHHRAYGSVPRRFD